MAIQQLTGPATARAIRHLGINRPRATAFGIWDHARDVRYDFHRHRRHQLLCPTDGHALVETARHLYVLSKGFALWLPAGTRHATTTGRAPILSVFLDSLKYPALRDSPCLVRVVPLLRETMSRAVTTPAPSRPILDSLFHVIHHTAGENLQPSHQIALPLAQSAPLRRAVSLIFERKALLSVADLAPLSGQSERTLRRRFATELALGPEQFILRARLIIAMHLLVAHPSATITELALQAGYSNHSAFSAAFRKFTGLTPQAYRVAHRPDRT